MKLGFLGINFSPVDIDNNVANIEIIRMAELLRQRGAEVDCLGYEQTKYAKAFSQVNVNDYDAFIVMAGGCDFFGGVFNQPLAANYEFLAKAHQPIFYMLDDLGQPFMQIYKNCCRALEHIGVKQLNDKVLKPYREKYFVTAPVTIVSQGRNLDEAKKLHKRSEINIVDYVYNANNEWLALTNEPYRENTGEFDLILGGSLRVRRAREETYIKYMFGQENIKACMYGTATLAKFTPELIEGQKLPEFLGKKKYADVIDTNARGFATLITGDRNYRDNVVTLRLGESILANCICFIDEIYDTTHYIFPDELFYYVNSRDELADKILYLKENPDVHVKLIGYQQYIYKTMQKRDCMKSLLEIIEKTVK